MKRIRNSAFWRDVVFPSKRHKSFEAWLKAGRPVPVPHIVKVRNLMTIADIYGIDTLIETGTYHGDMIDATKERFKTIYSIEVFEPLANLAVKKFDGWPNVNIVVGDSGIRLPEILSKISEPVILWLDGHYSGPGTGLGTIDTPIVAEIEHILRLRKGGGDVVVIDDARCFDGNAGYPKIEDFIEHLSSSFGCVPIVADDAIFIFPDQRR